MAILISSHSPFAGRMFSVAVDRVVLPHGREATMEVVRHAASAVLVPMVDAERVILIRQYRYPVDRVLWELPAGTLDPGETPEQAAVRECHEEIGLVPSQVTRLATFLPTPGYCDEEMVFFKLTGLSTPEQAAEPDPDEHIEPRIVSLAEARAMVYHGDIVDMKTALALMLV